VIRYLTPSKAFCRCGRLTADVARRNEINDYLIFTSIHFSHVFEHISVTFHQNTGEFLATARMVEKPDETPGKMESAGDLLRGSRWSFGVARPSWWGFGPIQPGSYRRVSKFCCFGMCEWNSPGVCLDDR